MSIKVKIGGGRSIKAIPKEGSKTPIVAPAERKPQIVPDSVVLGVDTIGNYVIQVSNTDGIFITQTEFRQGANVVIGHANTSSEISTTNDVLSFPRNIGIDQFGHVTQFNNISLDSLSFSSNGTVITSNDFTLGNTSLTLGETVSTIDGLTNLGVDGEAIFGSVEVGDLSPNRIVYVGANGSLIDSANLSFDGVSLTATGGVFLNGLEVQGQSTFSSVNVEDLTDSRLVYVGADGELIDSANLTFDGVNLTATGGILLGGLNVSGQTTLDSLNVEDLTPTRIVYVGTDGELIDSSGLTFDGTSLTATGGVFLSGLQVLGQSEFDSVNVNDLTDGRITFAGVDGELVDSANLTFDGVSLTATGGVFLDGLEVQGQSTFGSVNVTDLTQTRIVYVGPNGELIDSAGLTFDGTSLTATGGVFLDGLEVQGQSTFGSVNVTDLTQDRVILAGPSGELTDTSKLRFSANTLTVEGNADIYGNLTLGGNLRIGDADVDTVNVVADFTSDLIPDSSVTFDLGSIGKNWNRLFAPILKSDSGIITIDTTGALKIPVGATVDRPTPATGMLRYNSTDDRFEGYDGNAWSELAGSVKDVDKDTFIRAETAAGDDNDQLDFFTGGTQRLQVDSAGNFKFGTDLDKLVIDSSGNVTANGSSFAIAGTLGVDSQATIASLAVSDIPSQAVVYSGPGGELNGTANLAWDGTNLTIVGGITVDGDFSTSGGLSGDSLSVGNLVANTVIFVSETGALSSNASLAFDGETFAVNAHTTFSNDLFVDSLTQDRIVIAGANGQILDSNALTFDGSTLDVDGAAVVSSMQVEDLTQGRVVIVGASGELEDSADLTFDGTTLTSNSNLDITGNIEADGTLNAGETTVTSATVQDLTDGRVILAGTGGALEDSANLTFDGSTFEVGANVSISGSLTIGDGASFGGDQVTVPSLNVEDLTQNRIVTVGANGELEDSATFTFDGSTFRVDGDGQFTGNVTIAGNLQLGDQIQDTINVVADFASDLVPKDDNTFDLGEGQLLNSNGVVVTTGSNWRNIYVRGMGSDTGVVTVNTTGAFTVPVGTTDDRPDPLATGMIRFNSSDGVFEGYSGTAWASLGGVKDVDQDTFIDAESAPGDDNDELRFFTAGNMAFKINSSGEIETANGNNSDLVLNLNGNFNVGNTIITGIDDPVNVFDAVNKNYLENTYSRNFFVTKTANTYSLDLLDSTNPAKLELGVAINGNFDNANNKVTIELAPVWDSLEYDSRVNSFELIEAGTEGTVPNFEFDAFGRVRSLVNIPLSVSSNAVVDFADSIFDVVADSVRNGNIERGISVIPDFTNFKLDFTVDSFDIDLEGDITGSARVINNSNTTITTSYDFTNLDTRYLNVSGDAATGNLDAPRFRDSSNTDYYADPASTSRFDELILGYGKSQSSLQMNTNAGFQTLYATSTKIGFLSSSFNFSTYYDQSDNSWRVEDGSVFSRNFVDSQDPTYLLNPNGNTSRFKRLALDERLTMNSTLVLDDSGISTTSGGITFNPNSGSINVSSAIITSLADPVNNLDAVNKQYLDTEVADIRSSGLQLAAENGAVDTVALGEIITFAAGEGIETTVSNNQILIAGELASDTNIGVASFSINNFTVTSGDVEVTALDGGTF